MKLMKHLIFLLFVLICGISFAQEKPDNDTRLLMAAYEGQTDSVIHLIMDSADVNARSDEGNTPLMYAAEKGYEDIVKILLFNKADPNRVPFSGRTALISAAIQNHPEIVYDLLLYGADIDATDDINATALIYCSGYNLPYMTQYLLENRADTRIVTIDSTNALLCAAYFGNDEIVDLLLANKVAVNNTDMHGFTPLTVGVQNGDIPLLDTLFKAKADAKTHFHVKPVKNLIDYARVLNQKKTIKTLRKQGIHGTILPYFDKITISYNLGTFSVQDYYMGGGIGIFDSKYNFQVELGYNEGLIKKRILEKQSDSVSYQLWEKRRFLYISLDKSFTFPSNNRFERQGIFIRVKGLYSFGTFDAMRHKPKAKFALLPGIGYSYSYKGFYFKAAYEYGKTETYGTSPHWISLTMGVGINFRKTPLTKKINWM